MYQTFIFVKEQITLNQGLRLLQAAQIKYSKFYAVLINTRKEKIPEDYFSSIFPSK